LQSPEQKYGPLVIVFGAMIVTGLPLEITKKLFGCKLCLRLKKTVKRMQLWAIRKVASLFAFVEDMPTKQKIATA